MMTNDITRSRACLALFSGGLDSLLSVKWMTKLGYRVIPIFFSTPFFPTTKALLSAKENQLELQVVDILPLHLEMLHSPRYGFGRNFNPCIDCHALMIAEAGKLLSSYNADFIITGEVMGQRPMSQNRRALDTVARLSKYEDLLVRPLSQQLLPPTLPLREGWVNKDELLSFRGRSRKPQIKLAQELGINTYPAPGGGCLLTNPDYSLRIKDLLDHQTLDRCDIELLKYGRHFRLSPFTKMILARTGSEMEELFNSYPDLLFMRSASHSGPWAVIRYSKLIAADLQLAANILLSYCNKAPNSAEVLYGQGEEFSHKLIAHKLDRSAFMPLILSTDKEK